MKSPVVYLNGQFVQLKDARVSILDRGFNYGDGLFETMRAYRGKIFHLDLHLDRLFRSAELIYLKLLLTRDELASVISETLEKNHCPEAYIRLTVTRGEAIPGLLMEPSVSPTVVVYVRPFRTLPQKWYRQGVSISLFPSTAIKTSGLKEQVKSCNYLSHIVVREMAVRENSYEGILLDGKNKVTEGATSNIFIVKDGIVKTPKTGRWVLPGVTRQVVLEIARGKKIPCSEQALTRDEVYQADEVFLTNTGIEILPVTQAGQRRVGNGKPGKTTRLLHKAYLKIAASL